MKLIIDIPKETYEYWKEHSHEYVLSEAIKNGIPLPKCHGRLIDEDILCGRLRDSYLDSFGRMRVAKVLENMDAIIEADGGDI